MVCPIWGGLDWGPLCCRMVLEGRRNFIRLGGPGYHPQTKLREGDVFTGVYSQKRGFHVTITHDAWVATPPQTWDMGTYPPTLLTSGVHHGRPVQTSSLEA